MVSICLPKVTHIDDVSPRNCYCHTKSEYEVTWQKAKCLNMNGCVAVRLLWCRLYHEWATHLQRRTRQICLQIGDDGGDMGSQGFCLTTDVTCENNDIIFNTHNFTTTAQAGVGQKHTPWWLWGILILWALKYHLLSKHLPDYVILVFHLTSLSYLDGSIVDLSNTSQTSQWNQKHRPWWFSKIITSLTMFDLNNCKTLKNHEIPMKKGNMCKKTHRYYIV